VGIGAGVDYQRYNRLRIRANHAYFVAMLLAAHPPLWLGGLALVAAGESLRIWAAGTLRKGQALVTHGPYRFTRNPLYLGSLLTALGAGLMVGNWWLLGGMLALLLPLYHGLIKREEACLAERFSEPYQRYRQAVARYLPGRAVVAGVGGDFSWRRVVANHEHLTWLALAGFLVLLFARVNVFP